MYLMSLKEWLHSVEFFRTGMLVDGFIETGVMKRSTVERGTIERGSTERRIIA